MAKLLVMYKNEAMEMIVFFVFLPNWVDDVIGSIMVSKTIRLGSSPNRPAKFDFTGSTSAPLDCCNGILASLLKRGKYSSLTYYAECP